MTFVKQSECPASGRGPAAAVRAAAAAVTTNLQRTASIRSYCLGWFVVGIIFVGTGDTAAAAGTAATATTGADRCAVTTGAAAAASAAGAYAEGGPVCVLQIHSYKTANVVFAIRLLRHF